MIEYLFPTPFYKNNIPCPKKEWDGMMDVCERFYNKNISTYSNNFLNGLYQENKETYCTTHLIKIL